MEDAANNIVAHYERHALSWDADRRAAAWTDKPYIERFLEHLPAGAAVLDLGCGGGDPVALHMVARGFHVTGIDSSPTLISLCRSRMPDQEWIAADMRALALGRRFQGALLMFNAGAAKGDAIGSYRGDPLYHSSLDPSDYQALLAGAGFALIGNFTGDFARGGRASWLARAAHAARWP